jgi:tetratricopeptide (TPR) repeat protein
MRKRWWLLPTIALILLIVAAASLPAVLRAMPSRYVARLPQPVQALGVRSHVEALPTAAAAGDASYLLAEIDSPATAPAATHTAPPTPTPLPTTSHDRETATVNVAAPAPTAEPSPTPEPTATPAAPIPPSARIQPVVHHFQDWNNCGPATLSMALSYFQIYRTQTQTASFLKPDKEDRNVSPWEMAAYVDEFTGISALYRANGNLDTLRRLIAAGFPVIVEVGIDPPGDYAWMEWYGHYLLPVAYEDASRTFWVYDSWFGTSEVPAENADAEGRPIDYDILDEYWRQFVRSYVVLYPPEERATVSEIVGADMDDGTMWQNALRRTQAELQADLDDAHTWFNLGTVYNALEDYRRAADAFDHARGLGLPWRMLWYQFGPYEAYYETGRYDDVIVLADVTLQDRPYFEEAFYYKGLALAALGDAREARRNFEKAAAFNPNFAPVQAALANLE